MYMHLLFCNDLYKGYSHELSTLFPLCPYPHPPCFLSSPSLYLSPPSRPVHLYKCDAQRGSCGLCLKADPLFGCVWCKAENRCALKQHCPHPENQWLEHNGINSKCTHPKITQVGRTPGRRCISAHTPMHSVQTSH